MLVGQNLDQNQVLVSLKTDWKGCSADVLLFKVFLEQVPVCWPFCVSYRFCSG